MRISSKEDLLHSTNVDLETDWVDSAVVSFVDDGFPTETSEAQLEVQDSVEPLLDSYKAGTASPVKLLRDAHIQYLYKGLEGLGPWFVSLDASRPWLVYWILHSLDLLGEPISKDVASRAIAALAQCQHASGGFAGGHGQLPHVAPTYAAIHALAIIGTSEAFETIKRQELLEWLLRMKQPDGSFTMHDGGEVDVRGTYCALSSAKLLNILTPELVANCGDFIARCQTHEGGLGGYPGLEAHGGYTFCAVAAMEMIGKTEMLDLSKLTAWLCSRQMEVEGGFQGRSNKLVDGCYSFWQGALVPILECALARASDEGEDVDLFNRDPLQEYILLCCQEPKGGLRDKPDKGPDYYHTCYVLSGLSIAQHKYTWNAEQEDIINCPDQTTIVGVKENQLPVTHPIHNILVPHVARIRAHFLDHIEDV
ncbi:terpenoid cyclases/protein prenyltransferase alpha-alpha toroid [Powellomyces hirtus]|nr:terpenoid cyclases/protein prenyltransferase alpha-alpha toroid [Powellomyces hirtus]